MLYPLSYGRFVTGNITMFADGLCGCMAGFADESATEVAAKKRRVVWRCEPAIRDENWLTYRHFNEVFTKKYKRQSHTGAAYGYDAVHLLAQAIRRANSSVPERIAKALHATRQWPGATGEFTFDDNGDISNKKIGIKVVRGDKFKTVQ